MSREITPEHRAKMEAGRQRQLAEEAERKAQAEVDYSAWVQEDGRLWRAYLAAEASDDRVAAAHAWKLNLRRMPRLP